MRAYCISHKGGELASQLISAGHFTIHQYDSLASTLSRIMRMCPAHARIAEAFCSEDMGDKKRARLEKRDAQLEATMTRIAGELPSSKNGPCELVFQGDPRGYTVKLKVPNAPNSGNTWGLGGEYGL